MTIPQLVFTLCAPYGAWGAASQSSATTAYKATELDPPKSALIGLLGAALGLERARLGELAQMLWVAVRVGVRPQRDPKPDYHTISRPEPPKDRSRWSRFEEMRTALGGRSTTGAMLSRREYWSGGLWTVAVAPKPDSPWSAQHLCAALRTPRWVLYAGRKACTLGLPPDPILYEDAAGPEVALNDYRWPWERPGLTESLVFLRQQHQRQYPPPNAGELLFDGDYPGAPQPNTARDLREHRRRDHPDPLARGNGDIYQRFQERTECRTPFMPTPIPPKDTTEATA